MSLNNFKFILSVVPLFVVIFLLQLMRKFVCNAKWSKVCGRIQIAVLLVYSFFFIGYTDFRFAVCIAVVCGITYIAGILMDKYEKQKRFFLAGGTACILMLGYFKYCNFFLESFLKIFHKEFVALNLILPLGISFYIFTALSYLFDVYYKKYRAEKNVLDFALFITFFPKVTAGPIIRGTEFFPQVKDYVGINFANFETGIQIFIFGLFKKMVLADRLSVFVDDVFFAPSAYNTGTVLLAVISYSLQIYFDFSGYSDMAIGISKILGFDFSRNFNLPYLSESVSEFWKRWHISLSSWFQDYLYIPLGGNRKGNARTYINLIIVMLVSGLWHGAGWTFILWGLLHGLVSCVYRIYRKKHSDMSTGVMWKFLRMGCTFVIVSLLWIFFRASDLNNAVEMLHSLFSIHGGISQPYTWSFFAIVCLAVASITAMIKGKNGNGVNGFYPILNLNKFWSLVIFFVFCGLTVMMGYYGNTAFIYGKF